MSSEHSNFIKTVSDSKTQKSKTVEGQLWGTFRALAEAEGRVYLLSKLKSLGLATNDVKNFTEKQVLHKKMSSSIDYRVLRTAMRSKLSDACAHAKMLRQNKNTLKNRLTKKYQHHKSKRKHILEDMVRRYRQLKIIEVQKAEKKIGLYRERNVVEKSLRQAPSATGELLSGVNLFSDSQALQPEEALPPFICHSSLEFNDNELKLLARGPKFMLRGELSKEDFDVEVEKMVVKRKFEQAFKVEDDLSDAKQVPPNTGSTEVAASNHVQRGSDQYERLDELKVKWEEHSSKMIYNVQSNSLDMGNLQATSYKHNKNIFLPQNSEPIDIESAHQTRRAELTRVFNRVKGVEIKSQKQTNVESNLTPDENLGLKSLQKRVKDGSLVIAETDKSKRFACLTRDQYIASGMVHAGKDIEISPSKVKRIQNTVNDHTWWFKEMSNCGKKLGSLRPYVQKYQ